MGVELPEDLRNLKVALVHDWLVSCGGGERALKSLHEAFPEAPIYTLVYDKEKAPEWCRDCDVRTTYLQKWPIAKDHHRLLLSFMPRAWEALDLMEYDLVVSSCSSCCKGVITRPDAVHMCYCHTPTRYVWDLYHEYLKNSPRVKRVFMRLLIPKVRQWDFQAAQRVDYFVSNSDYVGRRIQKYYRRSSTTIYNGGGLAPVEAAEPGGYYLVVSRLTRYKRVDIAVEACNMLGRRLVVVGRGEEEEQLRQQAGSTVEFRNNVADRELAGLYAHANALLFPGVEDYGLVPIEAMSCGCPVLAYGKGGALETIDNSVTGFFFNEQTPEGLAGCIERFEQNGVMRTREEIADYAQSRFSSERFKHQMSNFCRQAVSMARGGGVVARNFHAVRRSIWLAA